MHAPAYFLNLPPPARGARPYAANKVIQMSAGGRPTQPGHKLSRSIIMMLSRTSVYDMNRSRYVANNCLDKGNARRCAGRRISRSTTFGNHPNRG